MGRWRLFRVTVNDKAVYFWVFLLIEVLNYSYF